MVAKLVELHGGNVIIESELGKGSRFIVTLPQISPLAPAQKAEPKDEADRRTCHRVLIIEDDPTSGAILVKYLTELGLEAMIHTHSDGSVDSVLRERADVILLDILLPGDSGWMVLQRLKEHPSTQDIPVAVVSVVDEPERSLALGAMAHFTKPVSRAQLAKFFQREGVPPHSSAPFSSLSPAITGPILLLAEDNEANVQTIGGYFEEKGCTMHYAINGAIAVKLARELRPALILMDIQMPVMDGLTAIREIRCLAAGATDYMSKPVNLKALAELVKQRLSVRGNGQ
jgi:CheY-like chemotaxis protein